jgi:hypothetical protein
MKIRSSPTPTATASSAIPSRRWKISTANAIANATLAWSLGNELSAPWWTSSTVCLGWSANGRAWYQRCPRTALVSSATTAAMPAEAAASFERCEPPGRARNHVSAAIATRTKIAQAL